MKRINYSVLFVWTILMISGCNENTPSSAGDPVNPEAGTPVTITRVSIGTLSETIELNATSVFQLKTIIKANATGYLRFSDVRLGKYISRGQKIFVIKTKEAEALGNTVNLLDSSFHFSGTVSVASPAAGYVTALNHGAGDYVQDGEPLLELSDKNSFCFLLDLPYELRSYLKLNPDLTLRLPDGTQMKASVASQMPTVDPVSQTQRIVLKVNNKIPIPEGLIAKVDLVKTTRPYTVFLPKSAILSDETQNKFWVMKLIDSVTAVRVPVTKGIENGNQVEIIAPLFKDSDKILLTGNYGLSDTARVRISQ